MNLERNVSAALSEAGWVSGRSVEYREYVPQLLDIGCAIEGHPARFLREFFGLKIRLMKGVVDVTLTHVFNNVASTDIDALVHLVGEPVCLVGFVADATHFITHRGASLLLSYDWDNYVEIESFDSLLSVLAGIEYFPEQKRIEDVQKPQAWRE